MIRYSRELACAAPIFPDASAGYIILRDGEDDITRTLAFPDERLVVVPESRRTPYGPIVRIRYGPMVFLVDRHLNVFRIAVGKGYSGKTEDGVGIGLPVPELRSLWGPGEIQDDDAGLLWSCPRYPGTCMKVVDPGDGILRVAAVILTDVEKRRQEEVDPFPRGGMIDTKKRMLILRFREPEDE